MQIFVDTEFTDFVDPHLISLGMVSDRGEEFYVEVPYPQSSCSEFVREIVLPLLGQYPGASCRLEDLRLRVLKWLEIVRPNGEDLEICFDYQTDWDLFVKALEYDVPPWCKWRRISRNINELLRYEFHKKFELPDHHALYDALANRYAFRSR